MTKLLIFSDIHKDWQTLRQIIAKKTDIYISLGDFLFWGQGLKEVGKILAPLEKKLWLLPGNNETHKQTRDLCQKYNFLDFHKNKIKLGKYWLVGFGYSTPTPFNTPGEFKEAEFERGLKVFKNLKNLILFTHVPPKNTSLDLTYFGIHGGSLAVREFIEENQPIYCFSGHIHESEGKKEVLGKTTCFSVGKKGLEFSL